MTFKICDYARAVVPLWLFLSEFLKQMAPMTSTRHMFKANITIEKIYATFVVFHFCSAFSISSEVGRSVTQKNV